MPANLPDLTGQTIVVTGGNAGIGRETCIALARMGATIVLGARNEAKGRSAVAAVADACGDPGRVRLGLLDLASFSSIRAFAERVLREHERIDVLINNAGLVLDFKQFTDEGFEMTFGVNHLGHFLLTDLLLDGLKASAPARIINVSSFGHRMVRGRIEDYDPNSGRTYKGFDVYCRSKLANVLFTRELARRLEGTGVTANSVHPGFIRSDFGRDGDSPAMDIIYRTAGLLFFETSRQGARTSVYLASSPKVEGLTGGYYHGRLRRPASAAGRSDASAAWLWAESERLIAEADAEAGAGS